MSSKPDPEVSGTYYRTDPLLTSRRGYVALFLRPGGWFLFNAVWPGYEFSQVAGIWRAEGPLVTLAGAWAGSVDVVQPDGSFSFLRRFEMVFSHDPASGALSTAREDLRPGMFGWPGVLVFLGRDVIDGPAGEKLAKSMGDVDQQIRGLTAGN